MRIYILFIILILPAPLLCDFHIKYGTYTSIFLEEGEYDHSESYLQTINIILGNTYYYSSGISLSWKVDYMMEYFNIQQQNTTFYTIDYSPEYQSLHRISKKSHKHIYDIDFHRIKIEYSGVYYKITLGKDIFKWNNLYIFNIYNFFNQDLVSIKSDDLIQGVEFASISYQWANNNLLALYSSDKVSGGDLFIKYNYKGAFEEINILLANYKNNNLLSLSLNTDFFFNTQLKLNYLTYNPSLFTGLIYIGATVDDFRNDNKIYLLSTSIEKEVNLFNSIWTLYVEYLYNGFGEDSYDDYFNIISKHSIDAEEHDINLLYKFYIGVGILGNITNNIKLNIYDIVSYIDKSNYLYAALDYGINRFIAISLSSGIGFGDINEEFGKHYAEDRVVRSVPFNINIALKISI